METLKRSSGIHRAVERLDGTWYCATDPDNRGREHRWYTAVADDAHPAPVPGILQQIFPDYHGVAWYWCEVIPVRNPHPDGRYLLRFQAVDYRAEVWINGERISSHDGGETPFVFDITDSVRPAERNLIAVRVINPTAEPIDGLTLGQIPHGTKGIDSSPESMLNFGGIIGSVELLCRPSAYIAELVARPNAKNARINILALVLNTIASSVQASLRFSIAPAVGGETLQAGNAVRPLQPGQTLFETQLPLPEMSPWSVGEPFLYHLTAKLLPDSGGRGDEVSVRFAFRTFRFTDAHFRLNGRRFFWKGVRTNNDYPVGRAAPIEADVGRNELLHVKSLGLNAVRFRAAMARPSQLLTCDELGLVVYEECHAALALGRSPEMADHFDRAIREMVLRDRNHPCVVIWGLLTDAEDGPLFKHGVEALPMISFLDDSRLIFLNSGRADGHADVGSICNTGCAEWESTLQVTREDRQATGDVHLTPALPLTADQTHALRSMGVTHDAPVFISDMKIRGPVDLVDLVRRFQRAGRADASDSRLYATSLERFERDFDAWEMATVFGRPEDFFRSASLRSGQRVGELLTALRANAHVVGLTLGLSDDMIGGVGLLTAFRDLRPEARELSATGLAGLRWCLFAEPSCLRPGQEVRLEALLAHEDNLHPDEYPASFQLLDPNGQVVFEKRAVVEISTTGELPLAIPVMAETIPAPATSGRYRFVARFDSGASAAGDVTFVLLPTPRTAPPALTLWAQDAALADWLLRQQISHRLNDPADRGTPGEVVIVTTPADHISVRQSLNLLTERATQGSTIVFLDPEFFRSRDSSFGFFPAGEMAKITVLRDDGDPVDAWARRHPIFEGLHDVGLLDDHLFRDMLPLVAYTNVSNSANVVSAGHLCRMHPDEHRSAVLMSIHPIGRGRIILNAFPLVPNLDRLPTAERLFRNLLDFAGSNDPSK